MMMMIIIIIQKWTLQVQQAAHLWHFWDTGSPASISAALSLPGWKRCCTGTWWSLRRSWQQDRSEEECHLIQDQFHGLRSCQKLSDPVRSIFSQRSTWPVVLSSCKAQSMVYSCTKFVLILTICHNWGHPALTLYTKLLFCRLCGFRSKSRNNRTIYLRWPGYCINFVGNLESMEYARCFPLVYWDRNLIKR